MKKFLIDDEPQFEKTVERLDRWYGLRNAAACDSALPDDERAFRLRDCNRIIYDLRRALRDYLLECALHDDETIAQLWEETASSAEMMQPGTGPRRLTYD